MEDKQKPKQSIFKQLDRSDLISLMALLISMGAFGVSLYEANIMRSQQAIMQDQQRAAVWPYLECETRFVYDNDLANITLSLVNKGVGPARINDAQWFLQKQPFNDYNTFVNQVRAILPANLGYSLEFGHPDGILSAGDTHLVLSIRGPRFTNDQDFFRQINFQYQVCYCSIYGDCWTIDDQSRQAKAGCE